MQQLEHGETSKKNFFVSYNRHDKRWAEWVAWILEEAGYTVVIQAWDFRPGGNFVLDMQRAAAECQRTIAVLSKNYLASAYTQPEWAAAFASDPKSVERKLIPVRVDECEPDGILSSIVYVDLVNVVEEVARDRLLNAFQERDKPPQKPDYPGRRRAEFPGSHISSTFSISDTSSTSSDTSSTSSDTSSTSSDTSSTSSDTSSTSSDTSSTSSDTSSTSSDTSSTSSDTSSTSSDTSSTSNEVTEFSDIIIHTVKLAILSLVTLFIIVVIYSLVSGGFGKIYSLVSGSFGKPVEVFTPPDSVVSDISQQDKEYITSTSNKVQKAVLTPEVYRKLEKFLDAKMWREADQETFQVMLDFSQRKKEGFFEKKNILSYPCESLLAIDDLWMRKTNSKFGFSRQSEIWQAANKDKKAHPDKKIFEYFAQRVGWKIVENFFGRHVENENLGIDTQGNLPFKVTLNVYPQGLPYITKRLQECRNDTFEKLL